MDKKVLSKEGKEVKTIQLDDSVFNREVSDGSIYHAIRNELANLRVGNASTKTRSQVAGSHKKPWKQKGTGRARAGRKQSPVWVGGGISHGPQPRDYGYSLPRKIKRLAMKSLLSLKTKNDTLIVLEDLQVGKGKTKTLNEILKNIIPAERAVLIIRDEDQMVKRAGRNIPWLKSLSYNRLRAHDLFYAKQVVVLESAALKLNEFYGDAKKSTTTASA
ncbi:50S ribosomal protein L4 [Spirochaeta lutea]|uniref:Large ribosomal subunit protein uL4 n=1 Tax=Spirochaeta lutea TaxID=1480694 RepID=A0A098QSE7_9SPIO|nr:50S ribosomal protein L4 [Spirochaeta lutea]KGE70689.1 50S ribosomal protein L4 [Spirochaeta lutea]